VAQVAEYGLHGGEAPGDHLAADVRIDPRLHPVRVAFPALPLAQEEGHLAGLGLGRVAQTPASVLAGYTVALGASKAPVGVAPGGAVAAVGVQALTCRTDTVGVIRRELEVRRAVQPDALALRRLVVQRLGLVAVLGLLRVSADRADGSRCRRCRRRCSPRRVA